MFEIRNSIVVLIELSRLQWQSRINRLRHRLRSTSGWISLTGVIGFLIFYVALGVSIMSRREPADPENLRQWLSGGMVLYTLYHLLKQFWKSSSGGMLGSGATLSRDALEDASQMIHRTAAEALWLGGGPIDRSILVLREAVSVAPATLLKTFLLVVVLAIDVPSWIGLGAGVFLCLISVEWSRRIATTMINGFSVKVRRWLRLATTATAIGCVIQLGCIVWMETPQGSDPIVYSLHAMEGMSELAMGTSVQFLATPLQAAANLAVNGVSGLILPAIGFPVFLLIVLVHVDRWTMNRQVVLEQDGLRQLSQLRNRHNNKSDVWMRTSTFDSLLERWSPTPIFAIAMRQWHCVQKYSGNVMISFAIPMALSLSPLLTDQQNEQWVFVIGGIALSSLLLAPPALQIDFRRDWKRFGLLRSFPISPIAMGIGMLFLPVAITVLFQWSTLGIGAWIVRANVPQTIWFALTLPAIAVLGFAIENALFLMFPHRPNDQGIAMVIRTKATFLWKAFVLAMCPVVLLGWSMVSHSVCSPTIAPWVNSIGSWTIAWLIALGSVWLMIACWKSVQESSTA